MHPSHDLVAVLKKLRLTGLLHTLELQCRQAADDNLSYAEFLYRVLSEELERRQARQLERRLRQANFEHHKTLEDFDFSFNPSLPKAKIIELASCAFVSRHENVALVGPAGVGKSHIAQAIGHRACLAGFSVLYIQAHRMFARLRAAKASESIDAALAKLAAPHLLIIDDLGLRPLVADEPLLLYEVIRQRYERASLIITSNRAVDEWYPLFRDQLLASAALDRFLHHCHLLVLQGQSYRNPTHTPRPKPQTSSPVPPVPPPPPPAPDTTSRPPSP